MSNCETIKTAQNNIHDSIETLEEIAEFYFDELRFVDTGKLLGFACRLNSLIQKIENEYEYEYEYEYERD